MRENKSSKIRKRKNKKESKYDTFSLTMELKTPLITEEELEKEKREAEARKRKIAMKKIKKVVLAILVLVILAGGFWISDSYKPGQKALEALKSDEEVTVIEGKVTEFMPNQNKSNTGIIIYPGAKVEGNAYATLARKLAEKGYPVYTVDMPFNIAILSSKSAENIINEKTDIKNWVIVGHSLGGVAATTAAENIDSIKGLVYLASYPSNDNIKDNGVKVLSISGSKDGVIDFKKLVNSEKYLPNDTEYVEIEGGNHCQFGDYGHQKGDNKAVISEEEQQNITVDSIDSFINKNMI